MIYSDLLITSKSKLSVTNVDVKYHGELKHLSMHGAESYWTVVLGHVRIHSSLILVQ